MRGSLDEESAQRLGLSRCSRASACSDFETWEAHRMFYEDEHVAQTSIARVLFYSTLKSVLAWDSPRPQTPARVRHSIGKAVYIMNRFSRCQPARSLGANKQKTDSRVRVSTRGRVGKEHIETIVRLYYVSRVCAVLDGACGDAICVWMEGGRSLRCEIERCRLLREMLSMRSCLIVKKDEKMTTLRPSLLVLSALDITVFCRSVPP